MKNSKTFTDQELIAEEKRLHALISRFAGYRSIMRDNRDRATCSLRIVQGEIARRAERKLANLEDITPEILDRKFKAMRRHDCDEIVGIHPSLCYVAFDIYNGEIEGDHLQIEVDTADLAKAGYRTRLNLDHPSYRGV